MENKAIYFYALFFKKTIKKKLLCLSNFSFFISKNINILLSEVNNLY